MKKMLFAFAALLVLGTANIFAQIAIPDCNGNAGLEARIDAIENQGWVEQSREFIPVYYFAEPDPPFLNGMLRVTFAPACDPGDPCPRILMLYQEENTVTNRNGNCVWNPIRHY